MAAQKYRYLKGYTIDPGFSTQLETMEVNEMVYKVRWEHLDPGPIGEYVEVIDYDPTTNYIYEPVDLNSTDLLSQNGLNPSEGNPCFHQQFVYAIVMQTVENFERALGRKILWKSRLILKGGKIVGEQYVERLRIYPHATRDANAFYTDEKIALLFGYFEAGSKIQGSNFPGGTVFTCLSPDIVAHETTHAILDGIHPRYLENTNPDVPAFHEAFADIVALLQRFSNAVLVEHQLERTRGRLDEFNILGELATQFGQALKTGRGALRSAIGTYDNKTGKWKRIEPNPAAYQQEFESHKRGAILVATIFDAFVRLYHFRIKDLIRIASQGTGVLPLGAIHPDLVKRLSLELTEIADHLLAICIRAIDYCPPFDITFGAYLRALITADIDLCPSHENTYRISLIEAFREWGIFPDGVFTLSVYSLPWKAPNLVKKEVKALECMTAFLKKEIDPIFGLSDRRKIWLSYQKIQSSLQKFLMAANTPTRNDLSPNVWKRFLEKLGVVRDEVIHKYRVQEKYHDLVFAADTPLEVHSIREASRQGTDGEPLTQVIVTLTQTLRVKSGPFEGIKFRGGSTIIFSLRQNILKGDYIILNSIRNNNRLKKQLDYQLGIDACSVSELTYWGGRDTMINFEQLHFH